MIATVPSVSARSTRGIVLSFVPLTGGLSVHARPSPLGLASSASSRAPPGRVTWRRPQVSSGRVRPVGCCSCTRRREKPRPRIDGGGRARVRTDRAADVDEARLTVGRFAGAIVAAGAAQAGAPRRLLRRRGQRPLRSFPARRAGGRGGVDGGLVICGEEHADRRHRRARPAERPRHPHQRGDDRGPPTS